MNKLNKIYAIVASDYYGLTFGQEYYVREDFGTYFVIESNCGPMDFKNEEFSQFFSREKPQELKKKFIGEPPEMIHPLDFPACI